MHDDDVLIGKLKALQNTQNKHSCQLFTARLHSSQAVLKQQWLLPKLLRTKKNQ
jgi:hypothetical protein